MTVRVTTMDAELEFAIQPTTTGKQLFDQVSPPALQILCLRMKTEHVIACGRTSKFLLIGYGSDKFGNIFVIAQVVYWCAICASVGLTGVVCSWLENALTAFGDLNGMNQKRRNVWGERMKLHAFLTVRGLFLFVNLEALFTMVTCRADPCYVLVVVAESSVCKTFTM